MSVASPRSHQPQPIPTIARMDSRIGRQVGQFLRRNGAVGFTAKAAQLKSADASQHLNPTIAMQVSPIGCRAGQSRRRLGVVRTRVRVAHRQLEVALECVRDGGH